MIRQTTSMLAIGAMGAALLLAACGAEEEPADNATGPGISEEATPPAEPETTGDAVDAGDTTIADVITLDSVIRGDQRAGEDKARDKYRHPLETLNFFGLQPDMNVVELWPGRGWYADIIAPYVAKDGHYTAVLFSEEGGPGYAQRLNQALKDKIAGSPEVYGEVSYTVLSDSTFDIAPEASADMVLTFRNVHNWMKGGYADKVFKAMYRALKPGGVLGVVEHRGNPNVPQDPKAESGYVNAQTVIDMAEAAGFQLADRSEINANPRDTKDYEGGVWTLPPSLRGEEENKAQYEKIGESDRMTLKFVKPATSGLALLD